MTTKLISRARESVRAPTRRRLARAHNQHIRCLTSRVKCTLCDPRRQEKMADVSLRMDTFALFHRVPQRDSVADRSINENQAKLTEPNNACKNRKRAVLLRRRDWITVSAYVGSWDQNIRRPNRPPNDVKKNWRQKCETIKRTCFFFCSTGPAFVSRRSVAPFHVTTDPRVSSLLRPSLFQMTLR